MSVRKLNAKQGCKLAFIVSDKVHIVIIIASDVTRKGIWVIQGLTARNISTLDSTAWSIQVSEYPQGVLEYSEYS